MLEKIRIKRWKIRRSNNFFVGYKDSAEAWRAPYVEPSFNYTDADFLEDADRLWNQMKPLYQELHAYIRFKLNELYGDKVMPNLNGPIPAHLLSMRSFEDKLAYEYTEFLIAISDKK